MSEVYDSSETNQSPHHSFLLQEQASSLHIEKLALLQQPTTDADQQQQHWYRGKSPHKVLCSIILWCYHTITHILLPSLFITPSFPFCMFFLRAWNCSDYGVKIHRPLGMLEQEVLSLLALHGLCATYIGLDAKYTSWSSYSEAISLLAPSFPPMTMCCWRACYIHWYGCQVHAVHLPHDLRLLVFWLRASYNLSGAGFGLVLYWANPYHKHRLQVLAPL